MSSEEKKQDYVWSVYPEEPPEIKYQVKTLPLQKEVSIVRQALCRTYSKYEGNWAVMKKNASKRYGHLKDQLTSYGINKDSLIVQGGAVGGASLLGYLIGRNRGMIRRISYTVVGGALVGGAFYLSYEENRKWIKNELEQNFSKLKSKWPTRSR